MQNFDWKKENVEVVYKGSHRSMVKKTFAVPGAGSREYEVLADASCAIIACRTEDGRFIAIDRFMPGAEAQSVSFPGGHIDAGEDMATAAKREVLEETGHEPSEVIFLRSVPSSTYAESIQHYFLALGCKRVAGQTHEDVELGDMRFLSEKEIYDLTFSPTATIFEHVQCAALSIEYLRSHGQWNR